MAVTSAKAIPDLVKLQQALQAAGIAVPALGQLGPRLITYDAAGSPIDLPPAAQAVVDSFRGQRPKTVQEYRTEYAAANPVRQLQIVAIQLGLVDPELVDG